MKNKQQVGKTNTELLREIRDKINNDTKGMTFKQFKSFVNERLEDSIHPKEVWYKK
jgi:hypothetical protein